MPTIFVGMPHHSRKVDIGAAQGLFLTCCRPDSGFRVLPRAVCGSLLTNCFNRLWVEALKLRSNGFTHFAMIHSDVEPEPWWLEKLYAELVAHDADVISTVIPLKDSRALTSTGLSREYDTTNLVRRLTMHEIMKMPETFAIGDVCDFLSCGSEFLQPEDHRLMVNTGLWICDLRKPWVEEICFWIADEINWHAIDGEDDLVPSTATDPEDWNFSLDLARMGCKVMATRKVTVRHFGEIGFTNAKEWGDWQEDLDYKSIVQSGRALVG